MTSRAIRARLHSLAVLESHTGKRPEITADIKALRAMLAGAGAEEMEPEDDNADEGEESTCSD